MAMAHGSAQEIYLPFPHTYGLLFHIPTEFFRLHTHSSHCWTYFGVSCKSEAKQERGRKRFWSIIINLERKSFCIMFVLCRKSASEIQDALTSQLIRSWTWVRGETSLKNIEPNNNF